LLFSYFELLKLVMVGCVDMLCIFCEVVRRCSTRAMGMEVIPCCGVN